MDFFRSANDMPWAGGDARCNPLPEAHYNRVLPIEDSCLQLYGCHRTMCGWDKPESLGWRFRYLGRAGRRFWTVNGVWGELMLKGLILFPQDNVLIGACSVCFKSFFSICATHMSCDMCSRNAWTRFALILTVVLMPPKQGWQKKLLQEKHWGPFPSFWDFKSNKNNLLKRYGEVLVPNLKHFKRGGSPYQTALINTTPTKNHPPTVVERKSTVWDHMGFMFVDGELLMPGLTRTRSRAHAAPPPEVNWWIGWGALWQFSIVSYW